MARFAVAGGSLAVLVVHLALGHRARQQRLAPVAAMAAGWQRVVLTGNVDCAARSPELRVLCERCALDPPEPASGAFPGGQPSHRIDHIITSPEPQLERRVVLQWP